MQEFSDFKFQQLLNMLYWVTLSNFCKVGLDGAVEFAWTVLGVAYRFEGAGKAITSRFLFGRRMTKQVNHEIVEQS